MAFWAEQNAGRTEHRAPSEEREGGLTGSHFRSAFPEGASCSPHATYSTPYTPTQCIHTGSRYPLPLALPSTLAGCRPSLGPLLSCSAKTSNGRLRRRRFSLTAASTMPYHHNHKHKRHCVGVSCMPWHCCTWQATSMQPLPQAAARAKHAFHPSSPSSHIPTTHIYIHTGRWRVWDRSGERASE